MKNQKDLIVTGLALAAAIFTFAGCETTPKDERSAGRTLDDKKITENIRKSLDSEPTYKFKSVSVSTFAGIVQLSGFVNSDGQKGRAQDIAQRADGVTEVFNGITIKPAMPTATGKGGSKIYSEPQGSSGQPGRDNNSNQTTEPK
jgi:hypothetical protein